MVPKLNEILQETGYRPCGIRADLCSMVRGLNLNATDKTEVHFPCANCTSNPARYSAPDEMTSFNKEILGTMATLLVMPYSKK